VSTVYEIGPFRLDPAAGVLIRAGLPMPLGARAVAVLTALVKEPNEFVPKETILDAAWPDVVVEESNLAVQISAIRRTFADVPGGQHWIETLARRGYRFVGPVTEVHRSLPKGASGERENSNLPEPLTSFIGRERELVEIKRLLPGTRLLTLVGVGGIGKTRLALQVAAEVIAAYRDGVWLVDLAPLADPALVPSAVAQVLGLSEAVGKTPVETLCRQVRGRQLLLLLDNCEHVLEGSASLADALLRGTGELAIMATSREPLHVAGEQTYPLATLSLPDPAANVESVARSEAVQLFVERAREQLPDFALTAVRAPVVAELCIHLDGIPLALELAAARIRTLSIEQINARLNDRFKLLTSGTGNAPQRQKTLRATLDWSYDLLAEQQRMVLRRLGIFVGGFSLEAASAVASDGAIDEFGVIDQLSQLVARSLVLSNTSDTGARYRLLETTRAYALEKLAEAGETEAIKRRHAQYFRGLFESAFADWLRMSDAEWRAIYPPELDNVRWALDWALRAGGDAALGIALAGASRAMWTTLGLFGEGRQRLEFAVSRIESHTPESDLARLWLSLGVLLESPAPAQSVVYLEQAIGVYRRLSDTLALSYALVLIARPLAQMGRFDQSSLVLAEAFPMLEASGLPKLRGFFFGISGFLKSMTGDLVGARTDYEKALSLCLESGAEFAARATLAIVADLTWALGDLDAAVAAFNEVVAMMRMPTITRKTALGYALCNLAGVFTERGELDEALAAAREGLPLLTAGGGLAWLFMDHLALRGALAGKFANAARLAGFADSLRIANEAVLEPNEARAHARLQALLREKLAPDQLERLLAEGTKLTEDEACRLALEE
jgi:predicted ATPase/DNA-binding winged helix-turn-helix (wHTH) protein